MAYSFQSSVKGTLVAAAFLLAGTGQVLADGYKGAISADTTVFDVTLVSGDTVHTETWFAQWGGNVYSRALETDLAGGGTKIKRRQCERASWIAPERHVWREGDEPYLTKSHKMKLRRLENSIRKVKCKRAVRQLSGVSERALHHAKAWLGSRNLDTGSKGRNHKNIGSVKAWMFNNVPGVVSVRVNTQKPAQVSPLAISRLVE